ncbi:hypothetical protein AVEN_86499-1 [Araneus ventricosus]|uniref:Fibronectin type-III domain-containing protein n=1 Tax=Araneus ventricosus TaxID=182803 RepID=A0A4Y2JN76_ARAVE|nr:hypothetical protein AVEN_86499-1 [Araneus ventricosus]
MKTSVDKIDKVSYIHQDVLHITNIVDKNVYRTILAHIYVFILLNKIQTLILIFIFEVAVANTEDYPSHEENVGKDYPSDKVTVGNYSSGSQFISLDLGKKTGIPEEPGDPKIESVKGDCLLLKWASPQNALETKVKGYIIETWDNKTELWTLHTNTTENATKLCDVIGKESKLRVRAFNDKGTSLPSKNVFVGEFGPWIQVNSELLDIQDIITQSVGVIQSGSCSSPEFLECRTIDTHQDYLDVGQTVVCDVDKGFICRDSEQSSVCNSTIKDKCSCYVYEVRVGCAKSEDFLMSEEKGGDHPDIELEHEVYFDENAEDNTLENGTLAPSVLHRGGPDIEVEHEVYYDENYDENVAEFSSDVKGNEVEGDISVEHEVYFDDGSGNETQEFLKDETSNPISERLIYLHMTFIQIQRLRAESYAVVGQVINVPIDVNIMVQHLLRNLDDDQAFNENIEKRLNHKSIYLSGEVRKRVVRALLEYLQESW